MAEYPIPSPAEVKKKCADSRKEQEECIAVLTHRLEKVRSERDDCILAIHQNQARALF